MPQVQTWTSPGFSQHGASWTLYWTFFLCTILSNPGQPSYSDAFRWATDLAKFYQDWGPDLCESLRRAHMHSLTGVSFECPHQHPPWSPVSIGKPAPKIQQWTIYFCRWGFGWDEKAQCFRPARRFGAAGLSLDFSRVFHDMALPGLCLELFLNDCKVKVPQTPSTNPAHGRFPHIRTGRVNDLKTSI